MINEKEYNSELIQHIIHCYEIKKMYLRIEEFLIKLIKINNNIAFQKLIKMYNDNHFSNDMIIQKMMKINFDKKMIN